MAQHTVNIPCISDTYLDRLNPNTNYGSATILKGGGWRDQYPHHDYVALLKFDFSQFSKKKIISTYLNIYCLNKPSAGRSFVMDALPVSFSENIDTYNSINAMIPHISAWQVGAITANSWLRIKVFFYGTELNYFYNNGLAIKVVNSDDPSTMLEIASRESSNVPYIEVTYEDVPPQAPTPTEPIGQYKDSSAIIRFEWQYNSDVGGEQKAFDLQWSTDQINWTTVSQTTSNTYYDMPADTLPAGNIYWRVRCYNEYDEESPWSDVQVFYSIGAPSAPAINAIPTDTARPTVTWVAFSQQVYQLQVLSNDMIIYDSGIVPGINIRQHKIKAWLADGEYTVRIRIKNEYDLWSEWGSAAVTISTDKPEKPSIALQRSAYGVEITGTGLVYRSDYDKDDYICIGTASGTYFDNTVRSKGEYKYFVRAVSVNDTFEDSDIKFIQAELRHALIVPVSDLTNVFAFTRSLDTPPKRVYDRAPGGEYVLYAGRTYPVWEPSEHISTGLSLTFFLRTWAEVESFVALYDRKETVLYRDVKGRKIYGVMSGLQVTEDRTGYVVSFLLNQVDYNEEVEV